MNETTKGNLLVVDDAVPNLHFLVQALTDQGYAVRAACDGQQALAAAQAEPPDLILLDVRMPHMNGYQVCQALKADAHTRDVPVIFLSILAEAQEKARAFAVGGADYITKPFQMDEVLARVETHLARKKLQRDLQERNVQLDRANEALMRRMAEGEQARETLRRYAARLEILRGIDQSVLAARSPESIAVAAVPRIRRLIPSRRASVLVVAGPERLEMLASESSLDTGPLPGPGVYQELLQSQALERGLVQGVEDLAALPRRSPLQEALYGAGLRAYIVVPLFVQDELVGTLHLESEQPRAFTPEHIAIATEVAASLAVALRQIRLYEQSQQEIVERQRSERQVQQQKDLLESTIESLSHPFYVINVSDYTVEMANAAARKLAHSAAATGCYALRDGRDRPCEGGDHPCPLPQVVQTGKPARVEHVDYDANGAARYVEVHGYPLFDRAGKVAKMIEYSLDVTERVRAEQASREAAAAGERDRLARDLHDSVTQALFSATLVAEVLPELWEIDPEVARSKLDQLRRLTQGALAEMRTLLLELRPAALMARPLGELLAHLGQTLAGRTGIAVTTTADEDCDLPSDVQVALYRIAQEALNNVAKHAGAQQARLALDCQPGRVELCIEDDGCGFDPSGIQPGQLGVGIMHERAEGIGASLSIEGGPGQGTRVAVVWEEGSGRKTTDDG